MSIVHYLTGKVMSAVRLRFRDKMENTESDECFLIGSEDMDRLMFEFDLYVRKLCKELGVVGVEEWTEITEIVNNDPTDREKMLRILRSSHERLYQDLKVEDFEGLDLQDHRTWDLTDQKLVEKFPFLVLPRKEETTEPPRLHAPRLKNFLKCVRDALDKEYSLEICFRAQSGTWVDSLDIYNVLTPDDFARVLTAEKLYDYLKRFPIRFNHVQKAVTWTLVARTPGEHLPRSLPKDLVRLIGNMIVA